MAKRTETAPEPQEAPVAAPTAAPEGQGPDAAPAAEKAREAIYVVQMFTEVTTATGLGGGTAEKECWADIATVKAPPRSKRKKIVGLALAQSGVRPEVGGRLLRLRVLDAASAHVTEVAAVQRDPEFEIQ